MESLNKSGDTKKELDKLITKITLEFHDIKFSVYRTSLKLGRIQDAFHLRGITTTTLYSKVKKLILNKTNTSIDNVTTEGMNYEELEGLVRSLYHDSLSKVSKKLCECLCTLVFQTFQDFTENRVSVIAVVLFFIILGGEELVKKYKLLFSLYSGSLRMLTRSRCGLMLAHCVRLTDVVGEDINFGNISSAIASCFSGVLGASISEQQLLQWLFKEPQSLVWLPTMHRLNLAKSSVHEVQCAECKIRPIIGLRFQCLKCLDYDTCHHCFLTQSNSSRSHKLNHPRQEYCTPAGGREKVNAFARTIRNIVTKRYKQKPLSSSFLPIDQSPSSDNVVMETRDKLNESSDFVEINHLAAAEREELEKLVSKLKEENDKMSGTVQLLESTKHDVPSNEIEDRLILQSHLDTVTQQNKSLQSELDNLKCVVFADDFMTTGKSQSHHELSANQSEVSESCDERSTNKKTAKKRKKRAPRPTPEGDKDNEFVVDENMAGGLEAHLHHLVDRLGRNDEDGEMEDVVNAMVDAGEMFIRLLDVILVN
uniref:Zinc finger protein n=1 Tax=Ciona intestinalis TaxID=7719 RepID=Q1RL59_CIOIN|nr:zinc finger protein ZF(ZZ)-4 [Ciona intestinalis]FAA00206.1 TPA: zinc finger protein [Ciona intestinalis]|eukprot:NP_001122363.1 zinc finger protein ZF(ZZ)-4 [Ciona intestinalis]